MTDRPKTPLPLTDAQRRHLEVSLGQMLGEIEDALNWFERWPLQGRLQETARRDLQAAQDRIRGMATTLDLSPSNLRPDPRRRLEALRSHWWSTALDCRSQVLRGYGKVDPAVAPVLDPLVDQVAAALLRVGRPGDDEGDLGG